MTDYTTNALNQASWLVYINGLEIPVMGVVTDWGVWKMPTATIQLVPHPMLQRIGYEDRLQVVVFYLDEFWFADNPQFCLLGEFEVVGWSYSNSKSGRALQLECVAHDQIMAQLHFYYLSSVADIAGSVGEVEISGTFQTTKLIYPACLFMEGLTTPIELPEVLLEEGEENAAAGFIKRPIDFVTNVFRAILSPVNTPDNPVSGGNADSFLYTDTPGTLPLGGATAPNKNFFARWMKMTQYHKRWCAFPLLEDNKEETCFPILKAIQDTETLKALQSQLGERVGEAGSAWDLLQYVLGSMYMEVAMIPSPPTAVIEKTTGVIQNNVEQPNNNQFKGIMSRFVKPQCFFSLPPTCNVIFPSMIDSFSFRETYITQPTRLYLSEEFISNYLNTAKNGNLNTIVKELLGTGYPKPIRKRLLDLAAQTGVNDKSCLLYPEEFFKGPVAARLNGPPWMYMMWQQQKGELEQKKTLDEVVGESEGPEINSIFDAFAEYEYYRSRYAERQGGLSLAWNPYVLPGFPTAVFDQLNSGLHCMAYVNTVTHTMQAAGAMNTAVSLSFMRTMPEFMGIIGDETSFSQDIDISPVEIIPQIRDTFQVLTTAQQVYEKLLYRGQTLNRPAVFDWKAMLNLETAFGSFVQLNYDDLKSKKAFKNLNNYKLVPNAGFMPLFKDYTSAMQYVSRPVCTLKEYIEAYHGKPLHKLLYDGTVRGEYRSFYSVTRDKNKTEGAVFWGRIYKLIQGPGDDPGVNVSNVGPAPDYAPADPGTLRIVDRTTGMPETRRNWDEILEEYRKIVRSEEGKVAPQG